MRFTYCPDCGTKLIQKEIGDEGFMPYCDNCKKPLFDMFSSCIIALVANEKQEVALLRQNYISTDYYNLVSGYMKPGETAEETAVREVGEELGLTIDEPKITGTYWFDKKDMIMIGFLAKTIKQISNFPEKLILPFGYQQKKHLLWFIPKVAYPIPL